jgi:hypothetical protein
MAEQQPWLSLTEAARLTGLDREAIRSRARRGLVPSRKNNRGELLVQVPADLVTDPDRPLAEGMTGELTTMRAAMADLSAEIADLRTALAQAQAETEKAMAVGAARVAAARAEVEAQERYIAQLEALLAEARKPWWRRWRS